MCSSYDNATVYYLPGTTGWDDFSANTGIPVALWRPQMQTSDGSFGVRTNQFGFNINWASGMVIVVEACTNLATPVWSPVSTNTLTSGSSYFCDPQWTNYPARFYRLRWVFRQAQLYTFTTNNGTITITEYIGPGGDVAVPDTITGLPVTSIGEGAFASCTSLTSITIPDSVTSIGEGAFQYSDSLTNVIIGNGVTSTGDFAFADCTRLTSVTIPNSVTSIGNTAFGSCSGLTSITIPNSVTSIGDFAFAGCTGLASVMIPDSVTNIGRGAFWFCTNLNNVTIR